MVALCRVSGTFSEANYGHYLHICALPAHLWESEIIGRLGSAQALVDVWVEKLLGRTACGLVDCFELYWGEFAESSLASSSAVVFGFDLDDVCHAGLIACLAALAVEHVLL